MGFVLHDLYFYVYCFIYRSLSFWWSCFLPFDLQILITPLISSNRSYILWDRSCILCWKKYEYCWRKCLLGVNNNNTRIYKDYQYECCYIHRAIRHQYSPQTDLWILHYDFVLQTIIIRMICIIFSILIASIMFHTYSFRALA